MTAFWDSQRQMGDGAFVVHVMFIRLSNPSLSAILIQSAFCEPLST